MHRLFIISIIFLFFTGKSFTQIFYPMSVGNKYQIEEYMHSSDGESWHWFDVEITRDSTYNDTTFYNFSHVEQHRNFIKGLFHYDIEGQKLYRLMDIGILLAVDFNFAAGTEFGSFIEGSFEVYTSNGQSTEMVLGKERTTFKMGRTVSYPNNVLYYEWNIADSIGCFTVRNNHRIIAPAYHQNYTYTVISAIIDSQAINPIPLSFQVITQLNDRFLSEFPFSVDIAVNAPILSLLDSLYLIYEVERDSIVILLETVDFNRVLFRAMVDLDSTVLDVGDVVKLKVVATDETIYNNYVLEPDTGYFRINVLPNPTGIDSEIIAFSKFTLHQNYPNPFNPVTNIIYEIPEEGFVSLKVLDVLGNEITTLVNEEKPAGSYEVEFSTNIGSRELSSGIYFYRLQAGSFVETKKMILMR